MNLFNNLNKDLVERIDTLTDRVNLLTSRVFGSVKEPLTKDNVKLLSKSSIDSSIDSSKKYTDREIAEISRASIQSVKRWRNGANIGEHYRRVLKAYYPSGEFWYKISYLN